MSSRRSRTAAKQRSAARDRRGNPPAPEHRSAPSPLVLASAATLGLAALPLLPRVHARVLLAGAFEAAALVLAVLVLLLRRRIRAEGRTPHYRFAPNRVHWVQASMQACVYAYWGWYWPEVYGHIPLIAGQILFVYTLDMLVCWLRRDEWILGFGPFPIVLSTNLFMWFRDDWFALQFAMIALGVLGKEFVKWERDGRRTHVFNPSALSLSLFSIGLIVTGTTRITWGQDIAATLGLPPNIYVEVFLVGLVVQLLFSVTLVTVAAAAALCAMSLAYTSVTGTYHFVMTNIPIAVFLGLHLLVTDPATSPRATLGKIVFGGLYGALAFGLFGLFSALGVPTFYDKLLPVPLLNLTVRWLDRVSRRLAERMPWIEPAAMFDPRLLNRMAVGAWCAFFAVMIGTGFLGYRHPGRDREFWRQACEEGRFGACKTWATFLDLACRRDRASCVVLGEALRDGRAGKRDATGAGKAFARACDGGVAVACDELAALGKAEGPSSFRGACDGGDNDSCFILAELVANGFGTARDLEGAFRLYDNMCDQGFSRGCARLGQSYLSGEGTGTDIAKAIASLDRACDGGHAMSCVEVARVYRRAIGGANEEAATERLAKACSLGLRQACRPGVSPAAGAASTVEEAIEIQRLGG